MRYAIERRTGQLVDAEERTASRYAHYTCPSCSVEVALRKGDIRSACFAHFPGQGTPDCENYYPGLYNPSEHNNARSGPTARRPRLALYVSASGLTGPAAGWELQLLLPQAYDDQGSVVVEDGLWGKMTIPMAKLSKAPLRFAIRPKVGQIQVLPQAVNDSAYLDIIREPHSGLDDRLPNVFRYSEHGGRLLWDRRQPLFWGRGYIIVHHEALALSVPSALKVWSLRAQGEWRAHVIELPIGEDERVSSWVQRALDRTTEAPPVSLTIVSPPIAEVSPDEAVVVPVGASVVVGLFGEPGTRSPGEMWVRGTGDLRPHRILVHDELPALVSLGPIGEGLSDVYLPQEWDAELRLLGIRTPQFTEPRPAELLVESMGYSSALPIHSEKASAALEEIKAGRLLLKGLRLPPRLGSRLIISKSDPATIARTIKKAPIVPGPNEEMSRDFHAEFEQELSSLLLSTLKGDEEGVTLDLGNFGSIGTAKRARRSAATIPVELPSGIRKAVSWLLSCSLDAGTAEVLSSGDGVRAVGRVLEAGLRKDLPEVDARLLDRLVALGKVPSCLEPHTRALAWRLSRFALQAHCLPPSGAAGRGA